MKTQALFRVVRYDRAKDKGTVIERLPRDEAREASARFNQLHGHDWIGATSYPYTVTARERNPKFLEAK